MNCSDAPYFTVEHTLTKKNRTQKTAWFYPVPNPQTLNKVLFHFKRTSEEKWRERKRRATKKAHAVDMFHSEARWIAFLFLHCCSTVRLKDWMLPLKFWVYISEFSRDSNKYIYIIIIYKFNNNIHFKFRDIHQQKKTEVQFKWINNFATELVAKRHIFPLS